MNIFGVDKKSHVYFFLTKNILKGSLFSKTHSRLVLKNKMQLEKSNNFNVKKKVKYYKT